MAIMKGNAPKTIPAKLEIVGGGETNTLSLTFHNRTITDYDIKVKEVIESAFKSDADPVKARSDVSVQMVLYLVKEWETDYSLSLEGVREMENERVGICDAIVQGFHKVRRVELEGN